MIHPLGYMAGSFVVFRGVALEPEVIVKWTQMVTKSKYEHDVDRKKAQVEAQFGS